MPSHIFDACIKPSTAAHNKSFLNKKVEIIKERLTMDLMIRTTRSSASSFPISSLTSPSSRETSIL